MARRAKTPQRRDIRCYLCGHIFEVSARTMSTSCPKCHKAIKVEDIVVKTYMPVNDVQTTGSIRVTPRGRIAARQVRSGVGISCDGSIEGSVETEGHILLGGKSIWKGPDLKSTTLKVVDGAQIYGHVTVPWDREA